MYILFPISSFAIQVDIEDISDDKYFQAVHKELAGAKDSIYIAMYEISSRDFEERNILKFLKENAFEMCLYIKGSYWKI